VVVILRRLSSSSSSSSLSFIIQRRDDEKRERESMYKYKRVREKTVSKCGLFLSQLLFKADEFCFNFFSRKNLLSQTTEKKNNTNTHRTIAFRRDNIIHFTRKSNQNQSCLRSTTRW